MNAEIGFAGDILNWIFDVFMRAAFHKMQAINYLQYKQPDYSITHVAPKV